MKEQHRGCGGGAVSRVKWIAPWPATGREEVASAAVGGRLARGMDESPGRRARIKRTNGLAAAELHRRRRLHP